MKTNIKTLSKVQFIGLVALAVFLLPLASRAGFGISPPYVENEYLTRGSHYEQSIYLVRGDPVEDLKINLVVSVPNADGWFKIDKGAEFIMPKGETKMPIVISVDVPTNAEYKRYQGTIGVKTSSPQELAGGSVGITLGGQIDVNLNVTKEGSSNFKIRAVRVADFDESHKWFWWQVPAWINFEMQLENLGGFKVAPTNVAFDIYDNKNKNQVAKVEATSIKKTLPFTTGWVAVNLPTDLQSGSYWARYRIYKGSEIVSEDKLHLSVLKYNGTAEDRDRSAWKEFSSLQQRDQLEVVGSLILALVILIALTIGIILLTRYLGRRRASWLKKIFVKFSK